MKVIPDKRLFWFLKEDIELDLSEPSVLDMYVQQMITQGSAEDVKTLLKNIGFTKFKEAFARVKPFLPLEVRRFWEGCLGDT